jgi:SlyX protein
MPEPFDARVELLEFKVAHLEQALQELSDVVYRQQRELDALRDRSRQLREQMQQLEDRGGGDPSQAEVPPHY